MRSKASYFSVSAPLIKENMRRFWAVPVLAFLVYFLSGAFPILMSYRHLNYMARYIEMSLHNMQPFFMAAHLFVPVITAVLLYRYLQNVSSVAVMHSMPFTRSKLFNSSFLSGLILISLPILVNGIILLLLSKPTFNVWGYGDDLTIGAQNVFARAEILNWMGTSLLIVFVLFSVAVFTGIVTGNNLMHLLTSYFFIFLIPVLYAVFNLYFQQFLYGFDLSGNWMDLCLSISPYTSILSGGGYFTNYEVLFYIGTILVMFVVSAILYNKRKLERASDSLTFGFMKPILCYVIAFLGMTMLGFYFQILGDEEIYMYAGFAAGTIIFFIIGQMIVTKSARIFNREGMKSFIAYVLIAILFIAGLNLDLTGFEKRVPNPQRLNGATINMPSGSERWRSRNEAQPLTTAENIEAIAAFHRSILENRSRFEAMGNVYSTDIGFEYDTRGLMDMNRRYRIDYRFWAESAELKKIFESAEYKSKHSFYNVNADSYIRANFYTESYSDRNIYFDDPRLVEELVSQMEKDFRAMSYEEYISLRPAYGSIQVEYSYTEEGPMGGRDNTGYIHFGVPHSAENTINWLKAQGYSFELTADMVDRIEIYPRKQGDENFKPAAEVVTEDRSTGATGRTTLMTVREKDKIDKILKSYHTSAIDYDTAYEIQIIGNRPMEGQDLKEYDSNGEFYIYGYLNQSLDFLN